MDGREQINESGLISPEAALATLIGEPPPLRTFKRFLHHRLVDAGERAHGKWFIDLERWNRKAPNWMTIAYQQLNEIDREATRRRTAHEFVAPRRSPKFRENSGDASEKVGDALSTYPHPDVADALLIVIDLLTSLVSIDSADVVTIKVTGNGRTLPLTVSEEGLRAAIARAKQWKTQATPLPTID